MYGGYLGPRKMKTSEYIKFVSMLSSVFSYKIDNKKFDKLKYLIGLLSNSVTVDELLHTFIEYFQWGRITCLNNSESKLVLLKVTDILYISL